MMIVSEAEAKARLDSPFNLMNRLLASRSKPKNDAMSLFIPRPGQPQAQTSDIASTAERSEATPTLDDILENSDNQIKLGLAHDKSLELLTNSVAILSAKLDDVRADKLPSVISAASKVVESIRRERSESAKQGKDREVHYHFYTPQQKTVSDYKVIDVQ